MSVCSVCGKTAVGSVNVNMSAASSVPSRFEMRCQDHGGYLMSNDDQPPPATADGDGRMSGKDMSELLHETFEQHPELTVKAFDQVIGESAAENTALRRQIDALRAALATAERERDQLAEIDAFVRERLGDPRLADVPLKLLLEGVLVQRAGLLEQCAASESRARALREALVEAGEAIGDLYDDQGWMHTALIDYRGPISVANKVIRTALAAASAGPGVTGNRLTLSRAVEIATIAHDGQMDKSGVPYIEHPLAVMKMVDTEDERIVAVLHDVLEDTRVTVDDLRAEGATEHQITGLLAVTRREHEPYADAIRRALQDPIGRVVKWADHRHNTDPERLALLAPDVAERLRKKYERVHSLFAASDGPGAEPAAPTCKWCTQPVPSWGDVCASCEANMLAAHSDMADIPASPAQGSDEQEGA